MTRGIVIGKFMPVHKGHLALIRFGLAYCDELVVSMSFTPTDPISGSVRFDWLRELLALEPRVSLHYIPDDFDDPALPWSERIRVWARVLRSLYGTINCVFSSEDYGALLANELQAENYLFDPARREVPVSATQIRTSPMRYWNFLPPLVQPYFAKKICFYGPESTGKSTMARRMADHYQTQWVPEVAREFINSNAFTLADIEKIGKAQTERVREKLRQANRLLMCDTDLITTQIYCRHYLQVVPDILFDLEKQVRYDLYLLFDIDVAWVADGLRDQGSSEQRVEMMKLFRIELEKRSIPYVLISGNYQQREALVRREIESLLND